MLSGGLSTVRRLMVVALALLIGIAVGALATWLVLRKGLVGQVQALSSEVIRGAQEDLLRLASAQREVDREHATAQLDHGRHAVEQLVGPIRESLEKVGGSIQEFERARIEAYGSLLAQVRALDDAQRALRKETGNLVTALRSPTVRGRWGEMQLRRVVEAAGMLEHCDFAEQATIGGDGRLGRPDLIVRLAGGKYVVVDAKTPLQAYLEALEADDETVRSGRLDDHARQLRDHIHKLSAKGYWSQLPATPEFVVLFIPGETFFSAALERDPSLIEEATKRQVILATPTTLIAVLWAIAHGWREERLAENARQISDLGRELHERLGTMAGHFGKLKRSIDAVVTAYNAAAGSLETRVLVSARKLKELGATSTGEIAAVEPVEHVPRALSAPELVESVETLELPRARDAA
jgi:DNA recombination protein RmuC